MDLSSRTTHIFVSSSLTRIFPSENLYPAAELFPADAGEEISNIVAGTMTLDEMIADSEIVFGQMFSSKFEVTLYDVPDLSGEFITVYQEDGQYVKPIFSGVIDSSKRNKDGLDRRIVAYDNAYHYGAKDVASWWESFWTNRQSATILQLRESLVSHMGISAESVSLPNDSVVVSEDAAISSLTFSAAMKALCEINCCFPHFGRDGVLRYIVLDDESDAIDISSSYEGINSNFEDYETEEITGILFRDSSGATKRIVGTQSNMYAIGADNFLLYGMGSSQLDTIGNNMLSYIGGISYVPCEVKMIVGDLGYGLGSRVDSGISEFYIMQNSFSNAQLVDQTMRAVGSKHIDTDRRALETSSYILNEKFSRLTFDVEEFKVEFGEYAEATDGTLRAHSSSITQNANSISAEVTRATEAEASIITQTATAIETAVTGVAHNYTGAYRPTASNSPASGWSANDKAKHINDVFFDSSTGKSYRWTQSPKDGIKLKFNSQSKTENGYDYVYVYYLKNGTYYRHSTKLTGTGIANAEVFVPSSTAYVYWYSDSSATEWGFKIDSVSYVQDGTASYSSATLPRAVDKTVDMYDLPETAHPYTNGEAYTWQVNTDYSVSNGDSWGWVLVENQDINSRILQSADGIKTEVQGLDGQVSSISQRADSIEISVGNKVDKSSVIASINASQETVKISASKVTITGYVTFSDLSTAGQTTINGSNITTGTLNANLITTGSMSAARITSGILQDANANMTLNLSTGQISAKKLSVSSTNFTLTEAGVMTATGATINGTVNASSGNNKASLESARLKFYYQNTYKAGIWYDTSVACLSMHYGGDLEVGGTVHLSSTAATLSCGDYGFTVSTHYGQCDVTGNLRMYYGQLITQYGHSGASGYFYDAYGNQIEVEDGLIIGGLVI